MAHRAAALTQAGLKKCSHAQGADLAVAAVSPYLNALGDDAAVVHSRELALLPSNCETKAALSCRGSTSLPCSPPSQPQQR